MMHACVRKHHELRYHRHLVEGQSYVIKNFNVTMNTGQFRPIQSDIKILFMMTTTVTLIQEEKVFIPIHSFQFADYGTLTNRCMNNTYLSGSIFNKLLYTIFNSLSLSLSLYIYIYIYLFIYL